MIPAKPTLTLLTIAGLLATLLLASGATAARTAITEDGAIPDLDDREALCITYKPDPEPYLWAQVEARLLTVCILYGVAHDLLWGLLWEGPPGGEAIYCAIWTSIGEECDLDAGPAPTFLRFSGVAA